MKGLLVVVALGGLGYGGWKLYQRKMLGAQNAHLSCSLRIDFDHPVESQADCFATFDKLPPSGDRTDVRVELSGPTLAQPVSYDWAYLSGQDKREGPPLKPTDEPPLGRELRWRMPLPLVGSLQPQVGDFIVHAKLHWAGQQQDMARLNTKALYAPK